MICETGDPGDAFYIILRGRLSIWQGHSPKHGESWDEHARVQKVLQPGDSFGELALQSDDGVRSVTVKTEEPTVLAVLSKRNYLLTVGLALSHTHTHTFHNVILQSKHQLMTASVVHIQPF